MDPILFQRQRIADASDLPLFAGTPWYEGPFAALDFESTGVDPTTCRPVSVAFCSIRDDGTAGAGNLNLIVNCGVEVPEAAAAVHGLTTDLIRASGFAPDHAMRAVIARLTACAQTSVPVVIMNARYDWALLRCEGARCGLSVPDGVILIDPLVLDRQFDKYRKGKRTLADLYALYCADLPPLDAHDALADATGAIHVARAIARRHLAGVKLAELMELQRRWFIEQRDSLNAYWQRKGDPRRVRGTWPDGEGAS